MCAFNFLVKGAVCFANYHYCAKGQDRFAMQGQKLCSSDFLKSVIHKECDVDTIQAYSKFMSGERIDPSLTNFTNFRKLIFLYKRRFQYRELFIVCDLTFFSSQFSHFFQTGLKRLRMAWEALKRPNMPWIKAWNKPKIDLTSALKKGAFFYKRGSATIYFKNEF